MNKLKSINVNDWLEAKGALKFNVNVMNHKNVGGNRLKTQPLYCGIMKT